MKDGAAAGGAASRGVSSVARRNGTEAFVMPRRARCPEPCGLPIDGICVTYKPGQRSPCFNCWGCRKTIILTSERTLLVFKNVKLEDVAAFNAAALQRACVATGKSEEWLLDTAEKPRLPPWSFDPQCGGILGGVAVSISKVHVVAQNKCPHCSNPIVYNPAKLGRCMAGVDPGTRDEFSENLRARMVMIHGEDKVKAALAKWETSKLGMIAIEDAHDNEARDTRAVADLRATKSASNGMHVHRGSHLHIEPPKRVCPTPPSAPANPGRGGGGGGGGGGEGGAGGGGGGTSTPRSATVERCRLTQG